MIYCLWHSGKVDYTKALVTSYHLVRSICLLPSILEVMSSDFPSFFVYLGLSSRHVKCLCEVPNKLENAKNLIWENFCPVLLPHKQMSSFSRASTTLQQHLICKKFVPCYVVKGGEEAKCWHEFPYIFLFRGKKLQISLWGMPKCWWYFNK